jgi:hypothetical protein
MNWILMALAWPHPRQRVLCSYADGEVGRLTARAVSFHLPRCRRCREMVASHESVLVTMAQLTNPVDELELTRMVAGGRTRLLRSMGGSGRRPDSTERNPRGNAELIFGCRIPPQRESDSDATLDEIYLALLGSRAIGSPGSR